MEVQPDQEAVFGPRLVNVDSKSVVREFIQESNAQCTRAALRTSPATSRDPKLRCGELRALALEGPGKTTVGNSTG